MNIQDLQAEINALAQELAQIESGVQSSVVKKLLNIIERLAGENNNLKNELQKLSDEVNRLKGEQGKPDIKANKKKDGDISSEAERKKAEAEANGEAEGNSEEKKKRQRKAKRLKIKIDREQHCPLDKTGLPDDLVFKGYAGVVIQNLIIKQTTSTISAKYAIRPLSIRAITVNFRKTCAAKANMGRVFAP
jgi:hypothetical protein